MADQTGNSQKMPLSAEEERNLKEKIEIEIEMEIKKAQENQVCYRIYAHDAAEEDKKREINQQRINRIKNLYGF